MTRPGNHDPVRKVRIIARPNIGGPAIQAITLTKVLEQRGYGTRLVRRLEGQTEGQHGPSGRGPWRRPNADSDA